MSGKAVLADDESTALFHAIAGVLDGKDATNAIDALVNIVAFILNNEAARCGSAPSQVEEAIERFGRGVLDTIRINAPGAVQ